MKKEETRKNRYYNSMKTIGARKDCWKCRIGLVHKNHAKAIN